MNPLIDIKGSDLSVRLDTPGRLQNKTLHRVNTIDESCIHSTCHACGVFIPRGACFSRSEE